MKIIKEKVKVLLMAIIMDRLESEDCPTRCTDWEAGRRMGWLMWLS